MILICFQSLCSILLHNLGHIMHYVGVQLCINKPQVLLQQTHKLKGSKSQFSIQ